MATKFKKGEVIKVDAVIPQGPIEKIRMTEDGGIYYMISWTDKEGKTQTRWFDEAELIAG
jgi:uncharacterized protein YodC (DUF2158 family)